MADYKTYVVTFLDGTEHKQYANRVRVEGGVITIWSENYGVRDQINFPLANVKSWTTE